MEITENGKIYEVENEAGIGFTNMAQTGSLRIEKTSSDGKVEGFSFRVTGANGYDQTFKTDKNGEIFIDFVAPDTRINNIQLGVPVSINIENGVAAWHSPTSTE